MSKDAMHFFEASMGFMVGYAKRQGVTLEQVQKIVAAVYNSLDDNAVMDILMGSATILEDITTNLLSKTKYADNPPPPGEKEE